MDIENEKLKKRSKFLQSYIYTDYGNFFVSTCYRKSSCDIGDYFYETFAWRLDDKNKRTDWVADNSGCPFHLGAIRQHNEVCIQLFEKGEYTEK